MIVDIFVYWLFATFEQYKPVLHTHLKKKKFSDLKKTLWTPQFSCSSRHKMAA